MNLFQPDNLLWALLAIAVALLYLSLGRRRQVAVSTLGLWDQALAQRSGWSAWQRPLSLVLPLTIVALLALSLAHPYWSAAWNNARSIVLIVDTSASMKATDVAPSRWEAVRPQLRELVDGWGRYDRLAIVSAGSVIRVHTPLVGDAELLNTALAEVAPADGITRIDDAVALARTMLSGERNPQIVVATDGSFSSATYLEDQDLVSFLLPPASDSAAANVAITSFEARRSPSNPEQYDLFLRVQNFGESRVTSELAIHFQNESEVRTVRHDVPLEAKQHHDVFWSFEVSKNALITAHLSDDDALTADNTAQLVIVPEDEPLDDAPLFDFHRAKTTQDAGTKPEPPESLSLISFDRAPVVPVNTEEMVAAPPSLLTGNLVSVRESNIHRRVLPNNPVALQTTNSPSVPIRSLVILIAVAVLLAEWLLYQRRITV